MTKNLQDDFYFIDRVTLLYEEYLLFAPAYFFMLIFYLAVMLKSKKNSKLGTCSPPNEGGLGWVLTNHAPTKASNFNAIPLQAITHPNLTSKGEGTLCT